MTVGIITTATNIVCPACRRKLCKIREYTEISFVEIRHKGAFVLTLDAIVGCIDCKKTYQITANDGLGEEIEIGRQL